MTTDELNDRIDDIVSMGERRAKAHIKALYLDLIGEDETTDGAGTWEAGVRDKLRAELRLKVGDE